MPARFPRMVVVASGQSQCVMAFDGGGEPIDTPMAERPPASARLVSLLQGYMPGVAVSLHYGNYGDGSTASTMVGGTALVRSFNQAIGGSDAFWDDAVGEFDLHGRNLVTFTTSLADPAALCVLMHWQQSYDYNSPAFAPEVFAAAVTAYYTRLNAVLAPLFAEFRILPVPVGTLDSSGGGERKSGEGRAILEAIGGSGPPVFGAAPLPFVLRPVHPGATVVAGAYFDGSPDYNHHIRSTAWRAAGHAAVRLAGANGFVPPQIDQPRLARAVRTGAATVRAFLVSPQRLPIRLQSAWSDALFSLTEGSITAVGPVNNTAVTSTGYATVDLTVANVAPGARLRFAHDFGQYTGFVNGRVVPRGAMQRALWADPGDLPSLSDDAADVIKAAPVMHAAPVQLGVPVES